MEPRWRRRAVFVASLPERGVRSLAALLFGGVHETAQLLLPRLVRRSRFYEVTAKNALRIAVELVGGVAAQAPPENAEPGSEPEPSAGRVAVKKGVGNVVEIGSIAAFGFSPLWLLAAASDVLNGSRTYLRALEEELQKVNILAEGTHFGSVDDLLGTLEHSSGHTAGLIDMPPLELAELRRRVSELRTDVTGLPKASELAALFDGLKRTARIEDRSLLDVSTGVGLAFVISARNVTSEHVVAPYREDWKPLRSEGFGAYAARISTPYRDAISGHFDPAQRTWTEKLSAKAARRLRRGRR